MAGLGMYALAGALGGLGEGIAQRAAALRDEALASMKEANRQAERAEDRQWDMELYDYKQARKGGGGGSGGGGRGGSSSGSSSDGSQYVVLTAEEKAELGLPANGIYQRNRKSGNVTKLDEGADPADAPTVNVGAALNAAGIKETPELKSEIRRRVAAGESIDDVIAGFETDEEVTNPAGTMASRAIGLTPNDAPPDATTKVVRGSKPKPGAAPVAQTDGPSMSAPSAPASAIALLKADPSPEAMAEFDEIFGPGAAAAALR